MRAWGLALTGGVLSLAALLVGCTPGDVAKGQLVCQQMAVTGPVLSAVLTADGVPVTVTGKAAANVAGICTALNAVPVPAPSDQTVTPVRVPGTTP